ncbi:MAG: type II toxin-antitoxin system PemK/MazF family toxin [Deltaproteobacteria bacterium]|nr:type II toxin-antitoxin system PemK/MazF family toxin [Deltaproteobacteria bacterium]MBW1911545.1 type II toxin-antitoxin system PemK/MazF family toxin [Deltaproteobacteria bacterium]
MAEFIRGDVVVVPFPFSDLTDSKRRPALVLTGLMGNDCILCQITSQPIKDNYSIGLDDSDFEKGSLRQKSNIRPNRIFTCDEGIILYRVGNIRAQKMESIIRKVIEIIKS